MWLNEKSLRHTKSNCITYQTSTPSPDKYPGKNVGDLKCIIHGQREHFNSPPPK